MSIGHIPFSENGPLSPLELGGALLTDVKYHGEKLYLGGLHRSLGSVLNYQLKLRREEGHFKIVAPLSIIIALLRIDDRAAQEPRVHEDPQQLRRRRMFLL